MGAGSRGRRQRSRVERNHHSGLLRKLRKIRDRHHAPKHEHWFLPIRVGVTLCSCGKLLKTPEVLGQHTAHLERIGHTWKVVTPENGEEE